MSTVGLKAPPASLAGFPMRPRSRTSAELYRISYHRDRGGAVQSAWNFTSIPPGGNRFDVPLPRGTCYWSDRAYGAFVEVFRGTLVLDPVDVSRRRLFVASPPGLRLVDTTAPRAYAFGVTGEISTIPDYTLPQQWASAARRYGADGLLAYCRHDPSLNARNVAVFGPAGRPARQGSWLVRRQRIEGDARLDSDLRRLGVRTAAIPHSVSTISPP